MGRDGVDGDPAPESDGGPLEQEPVAGSTEEAPADTRPERELPVGPVGPVELARFYGADGYDAVDVTAVTVTTLPGTPGPCTVAVSDGCTFADVLADIDGDDAFEAEIPVRFAADDYAESGAVDTPNAELRQRGATSRTAPQKSFRVKLDKAAPLWRGERRLQLNKHPFDRSRMRNKLAFDLMHGVPELASLRTQFVQLAIDDGTGPVDQGLYTHVEHVGREYLLNRGFDADDGLYKAEELQFQPSELASLALGADGEPLDEAAFEAVVSIKRGDDHAPLVEAITAVSDQRVPFARTLDARFERDNVLAWLASNILLGQQDVGSQNYYLRRPIDSPRFRFLPWDYDNAFRTEPELVDSFAPAALRARLAHGFARWHDNLFTRRFLQEPGTYEALVQTARTLRAGPLSGAEVDARVASYAPLIRPIVARAPDIGNVAGVREPANMGVWDADVASLAGTVQSNLSHLLDGPHMPLPPFLKTPLSRVGGAVLSWEPAFAVSGGTLVYDVAVASSPDFAPGTIVLEANGVADSGGGVAPSDPDRRVQLAVELAAGEWFYRVVARVRDDGANALWQIANNTLVVEGQTFVGLRAFTVR